MVRRDRPPAVTAEPTARSRPKRARRRPRRVGRAAETDPLRHLAGVRIEAHDRAVAAVRDPERGRRGEDGRGPLADRRSGRRGVRLGVDTTSASSPASATHAPASLTATAAGLWPTGIVSATSVAGSMRVTVPSELFVTQTEPAPAAIADGPFPTPTDSNPRAEPGSTRRRTRWDRRSRSTERREQGRAVPRNTQRIWPGAA